VPLRLRCAAAQSTQSTLIQTAASWGVQRAHACWALPGVIIWGPGLSTVGRAETWWPLSAEKLDWLPD
jgi:hypothetical protein